MTGKPQTQSNPDVPLPARLQRALAEIHYASSHAARFYTVNLGHRIDFPLRHCFLNLKKLHGNLKNLLSLELAESDRSGFPARREIESLVRQYQSVSVISRSPGPDLLEYLIATESHQKRLQTGLLEELGDRRLKILISAQTAMLQITIDRMASFLDGEHRAD